MGPLGRSRGRPARGGPHVARSLCDDGSPVDVVVTPEMVQWPDGSPAFVDNQQRGEEYELWPL